MQLEYTLTHAICNVIRYYTVIRVISNVIRSFINSSTNWVNSLQRGTPVSF